MLKIDVIRFEAQDVITTSIPDAEDPVCNCPENHFDQREYEGSVIWFHNGSSGVDNCSDCPIH